MFCALYPDNDRSLVFSVEELRKTDIYPFRPVVFASMVPKYQLDMFKVLWQPRKGVFGYAQELCGNRLFHPEPELPDIYHTVEFGVADSYQIYQMLDWVEANLKCEQTDNGGKLLQEAKLFDVYTGHHIPEGKKSVAFSLVLRAEDKTMTDAEAESVMKNVLAGLEKDLGAVIR